MISLPNKLFERKINDIDIGINCIHLYSKKEIGDGQIGYSIDNKGNKIKDWIGENYLIIGNDSCCGDPIITDVNEKELPIYNMFHDDWDTLELIANSLEEYMDILEAIKNTDLEDRDDCDKFLDEFIDCIPNISFEYWESLIVSAFEFLTDEEY